MDIGLIKDKSVCGNQTGNLKYYFGSQKQEFY